MKRRFFISAAMVAVLGVTAMQASALTYTEQASGGFGSATLPAGAQEFFHDSFGAGAFYYDIFGRVVSNAAPTTNLLGTGPLTQINMTLWSVSDVDLFQINITNPSTFSAFITNTTNKLVLFDSTGKALVGSTGGAAVATDPNAIKGSDIPGLVAGLYYIGESNPGGQPHNAAGTAIFDFTSTGEVFPLPAVSDQVLASDPVLAWGLGSAGALIGPSTFTSGGSSIFLGGSNFAVLPEPASMSLLAGGAGLLMARRRRNSR
jgi:hypothetical protein